MVIAFESSKAVFTPSVAIILNIDGETVLPGSVSTSIFSLVVLCRLDAILCQVLPSSLL